MHNLIKILEPRDCAVELSHEKRNFMVVQNVVLQMHKPSSGARAQPSIGIQWGTCPAIQWGNSPAVTWPSWPPCPYMVKTLKNLLQNQKDLEIRNSECSIGCLSTTKFVQMMTLSWPWLILRQGQIWSLMLREKGKTMNFSEPIVIYDLKLATVDWSDKEFLLTSKLCLLGAALNQW